MNNWNTLRESILLLAHAHTLWMLTVGGLGVVFIRPLERMEQYAKQVGFHGKGIAVTCLHRILCVGIFLVGTYLAMRLWNLEPLEQFVNESVQRMLNS